MNTLHYINITLYSLSSPMKLHQQTTHADSHALCSAECMAICTRTEKGPIALFTQAYGLDIGMPMLSFSVIGKLMLIA